MKLLRGSAWCFTDKRRGFQGVSDRRVITAKQRCPARTTERSEAGPSWKPDATAKRWDCF